MEDQSCSDINIQFENTTAITEGKQAAEFLNRFVVLLLWKLFLDPRMGY